jgi:hypothetical protein
MTPPSFHSLAHTSSLILNPTACRASLMPWAALLVRIGAAVDGVTEKFGEGASNVKRGGAAIGLGGFKRGYSPVLYVGLCSQCRQHSFSVRLPLRERRDDGYVRRRRIAVAAGAGVMTWWRGAETMERAGAEAVGRGAGADVKTLGFAGRSDDLRERPSSFDDV